MTSYPAQYFGSATPIVNQTNVGSNTLSAQITSGGGGGGGSNLGPNPAVSSLTLPAYADNANGAITFSGGMAITDINSVTGLPQYYFDVNKPTANNSYAFVSSFASSITTFNIQQLFPQATSLCLASGDNGNAIVFTNTPTSTLALVANPVVIPGNLQVSSINGATPGGGGGGGGPNPSVSSLTINNFSANANGALAFAYDVPSQLNTLPANSIGLTQAVVKDSAGNNTNSLISFVNNGGSNVTADFASARVIVGSQGTGASASAKGTIAYDATANLMTFSPASISSLSVSSINGSSVGFSYVTGSVSSIASLPIANTVVSRAGKNQTVQFQFVYASTSTASNAGYIDMLASQMAPGNWRWQSQPSITLNGITSSGACVPIGANAQLSGDPGDLSQDLACSFQFTDSNVPTNILLTMNGIAYN